MHKHEYQYGKALSIFNIQDKESLKNWHLQGSVKKAYDKSVKGYVCVLDVNSKISAPKDGRNSKLECI